MAEPPITIQAYHTSSGSNLPVHRIVIHATSPGQHGTTASDNGMARNTAHYFQSSSSGGSAHYICDGQDEEHCVHDATIAWHAPPNTGSIGIEICAETTYDATAWSTPLVKACMEKAAARTAELAHRFGIPVVKLSPSDLLNGKRGICGHVDVTNAWHMSDHTDPGPHFPWSYFMSRVEVHYGAHPAPTPAPTVPKFPGRVLMLGVHGSDVHEWQMGANHYHNAKLVVDGQYGPHSVAAAKAIQQHARITVDGKVGPHTWAATFHS